MAVCRIAIAMFAKAHKLMDSKDENKRIKRAKKTSEKNERKKQAKNTSEENKRRSPAKIFRE